MTLPLETRLALQKAVRFRRFEDDGIVINQTTAEALVVNPVATRLLELLDGRRTLADCATLLGNEFDADDATLQRDVTAFARELVDAGVAAVVDAQDARP